MQYKRDGAFPNLICVPEPFSQEKHPIGYGPV